MKSRLPALMKSFSPASAMIANLVRKGVAESIGGDSAVDSTPVRGGERTGTGVRTTVPGFEFLRYRTAARVISKRSGLGKTGQCVTSTPTRMPAVTETVKITLPLSPQVFQKGRAAAGAQKAALRLLLSRHPCCVFPHVFSDQGGEYESG